MRINSIKEPAIIIMEALGKVIYLVNLFTYLYQWNLSIPTTVANYYLTEL